MLFLETATATVVELLKVEMATVMAVQDMETKTGNQVEARTGTQKGADPAVGENRGQATAGTEPKSEARTRTQTGTDPATESTRGKVTVEQQKAIELENQVKALDKDGGHSWSDHGAHTTQQQHEERLRTGKTPGGDARAIPNNSSKFTSNEKHMEAYNDALIKLDQQKFNTRGGLKLKVEIKRQPLKDCGTSYELNSNNQLIEKNVDGYTAVFRLNQQTQTYYLVTLYPESP